MSTLERKTDLTRWIVVTLVALGLLLGTGFFLLRQPKPPSPDLSPIPSHARPGPASSTAITDSAHERKMLQSVLEKKPDHVPVLLRLARLAADEKRTGEADRYLREIILREPANIDARLEMSRIMFDAGDVAGAIGMNSEILRLQPGSTDALYNLGAIYGNLGDYELARQNWTKAAADPDSPSGKRAREMLAILSKEIHR